MGVSEGSEGGGIGAECRVGTIVWVRRRNGSWWPGRILGPEELSASHLMSPRSGTPVKLLGREDASVDWYNLEKSKRVKAFRCGEFDACIERAEAAQGAPIKKREKYARREDAILHALELEKQMLQRKQQQSTGNSRNKHSGASRREQNIVISGHQLRIDESADHSRFISNPQFISGRVLSPPATSMDNSLRSHKRKVVKNYSWENDNTEATPRMRGLQDFGLRSAQSKMKDVEGVPSILSNKGCAPLKKRRSNGGINDDLLTKRRDRRRPLVQVLQSSEKLPPPHCLPSTSGSIPISMHKGHDQVGYGRKDEDFGLHDSSELLDYTGYSDHMDVNPSLFGRSGALIVQSTSTAVNESGLLEGAFSDPDPDTEDDETIYPGNAQSLVPASRSTEQYAEDDSLTFTDEENYENLIEDDESSYIFPHSPHEQNTDNTADMGVSKWNMKGKRNIRTSTKRCAGGSGDNIHRSAKHGRSSESNRHALKIREERQTPQALYGKNDFIYESDFIKKELHPRFARYDKRTSSLSNGTSRDNRDVLDASDKHFSGMSSTGWVSDLPSHTDQVACLAPKGDSSRPFCVGHLVDMESTCVDVDLKVQATFTCQGEHVPLVSLMSRWNGKAIVGHPVQIETVGDGSTLALLPKNFPREDSADADGNVTSPSVRKTGRRTAMQRVPRPHPRPSESDDKEHDSLLYTDPEMKTTFKKSHPVNFDNRTRLTKKSSHNHRQGTPTKVQKKSSKKVSLSNQKTRKLSSLATQQKHSKNRPVDGKPTTKGCAIDGFIKPGGVVPIVTCVPVKVVFSRILEAVGWSPSTTTIAHRSLLSGSSHWKPS